MLQLVHNFYYHLKGDQKCLPDEVPDKIMEILKESITCVEALDKKQKLPMKRKQQRTFMRCFKIAKKEVQKIMFSIDLNTIQCPENMTEKTYEINVTTSYTKQFKINIKNGLEVSKVIESERTAIPFCFSDNLSKGKSRTEPDNLRVTDGLTESDTPTQTERYTRSKYTTPMESQTELISSEESESQLQGTESKNKIESEYDNQSDIDSEMDFASDDYSKSSDETNDLLTHSRINKNQWDDIDVLKKKNPLNINDSLEKRQNFTNSKLSALSSKFRIENLIKPLF